MTNTVIQCDTRRYDCHAGQYQVVIPIMTAMRELIPKVMTAMRVNTTFGFRRNIVSLDELSSVYTELSSASGITRNHRQFRRV